MKLEFIKYKGDELIEAAKIILSEKLYENKDFYNYNLSKAIIKENVQSDYVIIFAVSKHCNYYGVIIVDYFQSAEKKFVSCYVKEKYRRKEIGTKLLRYIDKSNLFAHKGIYGSEEFWKKNCVKCFN